MVYFSTILQTHNLGSGGSHFWSRPAISETNWVLKFDFGMQLDAAKLSGTVCKFGC